MKAPTLEKDELILQLAEAIVARAKAEHPDNVKARAIELVRDVEADLLARILAMRQRQRY
jgi:hypothetical protein